MKLDTMECSFRDNIELNRGLTEAILSQASKIPVYVQTLCDITKLDFVICKGLCTDCISSAGPHAVHDWI